MQQAKDKIEDSRNKVGQCEVFVQNLKNEVIEWNADAKLSRRQKELGEVRQSLINLPSSLNRDLEQLKKHSQILEMQAQANPESPDSQKM